jgi:hypothetical protein
MSLALLQFVTTPVPARLTTAISPSPPALDVSFPPIAGPTAPVPLPPNCPATSGGSAKDFGARGDGYTNDAPSLQRAAAAGLGPLFLPVGVYRLSSSVTLARPLLAGARSRVYLDAGVTLRLLAQPRRAPLSNDPLFAGPGALGGGGAALGGGGGGSGNRLQLLYCSDPPSGLPMHPPTPQARLCLAWRGWRCTRSGGRDPTAHVSCMLEAHGCHAGHQHTRCKARRLGQLYAAHSEPLCLPLPPPPLVVVAARDALQAAADSCEQACTILQTTPLNLDRGVLLNPRTGYWGNSKAILIGAGTGWPGCACTRRPPVWLPPCHCPPEERKRFGTSAGW